jgi:hypothetical protein
MSELLCYNTEFRAGTELYSEAFDPTILTLINHYHRYDTNTHLDDRPLTPAQLREVHFTRKVIRKKTEHYSL